MLLCRLVLALLRGIELNEHEIDDLIEYLTSL